MAPELITNQLIGSIFTSLTKRLFFLEPGFWESMGAYEFFKIGQSAQGFPRVHRTCDTGARGLYSLLRTAGEQRISDTITKRRCSNNSKMDPEMVMSLALVRYNFSTPEIRLLMRHVLGHALSGRTIKRLARLAGNGLKRGRPPTTLKLHKGDVSDLIETTSSGLDAFGGNTSQFCHHIQLQFGLTPRQYLIWVAKLVRRGNHMMRKCRLCGELFPSLDSGARHCLNCKGKRRSLLIKHSEFVSEHCG